MNYNKPLSPALFKKKCAKIYFLKKCAKIYFLKKCAKGLFKKVRKKAFLKKVRKKAFLKKVRKRPFKKVWQKAFHKNFFTMSPSSVMISTSAIGIKWKYGDPVSQHQIVKSSLGVGGILPDHLTSSIQSVKSIV